MKRIKSILIIFIFIYFFSFVIVNAATTKVLDLSSSDDICEAVKSNSRMKIYVHDYYASKSTLTESGSDSCTNAKSTNDLLAIAYAMSMQLTGSLDLLDYVIEMEDK